MINRSVYTGQSSVFCHNAKDGHDLDDYIVMPWAYDHCGGLHFSLSDKAPAIYVIGLLKSIISKSNKPLQR